MSSKFVPVACAVAGLLFLFVAVKPAMSDQPLNATYFVLAIVFFILGFVLSRRSGAGAGVLRR
jgi:threonine/homoserine efflux transporter RhtA